MSDNVIGCIARSLAVSAGQARSEACFDQLRGTVEPKPPDAQSALYAADKCFLKEGREPRTFCRVVCHVLQFRAHP
jgi:hypothetical protein